MKLYTKTELRHLKWRMMKQEGLTEQQARNRIADFLQVTNQNHLNVLKQNLEKKKSKNFKDEFIKLTKRKRNEL